MNILYSTVEVNLEVDGSWSHSISSLRSFCVSVRQPETLCCDSSLCYTSVFIVTAGQLKGAEMVWQSDPQVFFSVCVCVHMRVDLHGADVQMSEELINRSDSFKPSSQQLCCLDTTSHKHWLTHNNITRLELHQLSQDTKHIDVDGLLIFFYLYETKLPENHNLASNSWFVYILSYRLFT